MAITDIPVALHRLALRHRLTHPRFLRLLPLVVIQAAALTVLYLTEYGVFGQVVALLAWGFLNGLFLMLVRRPALAALLSLAVVASLIVLSDFKFNVLEMTVSFFDFLIVDSDTITFLATIFPELRNQLILAALVVIPLLVLIWRIDPVRVRFRLAAAGAGLCLVSMAALTSAVPEQPWEPYQGINHISNFARSGVLSVSELMTHGWLEADAATADRLPPVVAGACAGGGHRPNIVMVLDESSFDITSAPGIKVPPGYDQHFRSFDGRKRGLVMEATGGPTVYAEYNVLAGLSVRSFGRFAFNVTRIAAGHVQRGLAAALRRCGYETVTLFPALKEFLSARRFQEGLGIDRFIDIKDMGITTDLQPDSFYYDQALRVIDQERSGRPLFVFVYVAANHFPWTHAFRPDLTPGWSALGNTPEVDEYVRRQTMSARDYRAFRDKLQASHPDQPFLVVRFGDHQPALSAHILEPRLEPLQLANRIATYDPTFFTTYYVIDPIHFTPVALDSALDTLDAPYLPIVVQEAAGLPLAPSFAEQKRVLQRCHGVFYGCADGAEARRFNRLLIDAGLIKGL